MRMSNTVMMVAKKLLHACIRRKKLILFLSVCVLSFFNFYITDNVVSMQTYRNRRKELQASPNPSVKPLRSLEHAFTNDASPESTNKTILYKMIKSTRKQLNRTETILDPGIKQPPDLTTSIDHQLKPDVHFNFAADEYSANLLGKTNDSSLIPDEKKLTTVKAEPKPCLGCEERQTTNYHGTDYMALPQYDYDPTYKNPCWKENGTLRCLPYFYIIGVKKSGTTELWRNIKMHPDFAFPDFGKEAQWFAKRRFNNIHYGRHHNPGKAFARDNIDAYIDMFRTASLVIERQYIPPSRNNTLLYHPMITGEASPSNLHLNSHWRYLPGNENLDEPKYVILDYIHHFLPRAKMIIIFRDPVDRFVPLRLHAHVISAEEIRLYSEYFHDYSRVLKQRQSSPDHFHNVVVSGLKLYKNCLKHHTLRSCVYDERIYSKTVINIQLGIHHVYWQELTRLFPREQILILQNKELLNIERTIGKIFTFLDMRPLPDFKWSNETRHANVRRPVDAVKGDMLNQTRKLLEDFYMPFNEEMCRLTGDKSFLYKHTE